MAAGAGFYDAQGVWRYGETDNIGTLFSDFMNVAPISVSTQFVADRSRLTTLETSVDNPTVYVASSEAARNAHWGTPTTGSTQLALQNLGATTIRTDLQITERYFANHSGGNPGGARVAGWYPVGNEALFMGTATRTAVSGTSYAPGASGFPYSEASDTMGWRNPSTNPDRITPNREGIYRVTCSAQWGANATGQRVGGVQKNAGDFLSFYGTGATVRNLSTSGTQYMNGTTDFFNAAGYLQDSGTSLAVFTQIMVEFMRPAVAVP